jgi:hypothetical protein
MRQSEIHYRQNDCLPRFLTNQPSLDNETEKRIVMLYTSGQSIESITREVCRARHRVVHILQARGIFGISQTVGEESGNELSILEERQEEFPGTGSGPESASEKPCKKLIRRAKTTRKATVETTLTPLAV